MAAVVAEGCNMGVAPMARASEFNNDERPGPNNGTYEPKPSERRILRS